MQPQPCPFTVQLFFDFWAIVFPRMAPQFFGYTIHQVIWPSPVPSCTATNRARFWDKISIWRKGSLKDCFPYEYVVFAHKNVNHVETWTTRHGPIHCLLKKSQTKEKKIHQVWERTKNEHLRRLAVWRHNKQKPKNHLRLCIPVFAYFFTSKVPARPCESCKNLRAGPAKMPFQNWHTANTNHFYLTDFCQMEIKNIILCGWSDSGE